MKELDKPANSTIIATTCNEEVKDSAEQVIEVIVNADDNLSDNTENQSYMSEVDDSEIMAAKKRLNFYDEKRLNNPVSIYE